MCIGRLAVRLFFKRLSKVLDNRKKKIIGDNFSVKKFDFRLIFLRLFSDHFWAPPSKKKKTFTSKPAPYAVQ